MKQSVTFGPFRLERASLELYRGRDRVEAPLRALALLDRLIDQPGELVSKRELLRAVWRDTHVTPSSLTEAMSRLRAVLGDDAARPRYVETLAGRGYRFVAAVRSPRRRALSAPRLAAAAVVAALLVSSAVWIVGTGEASPPVIVELSGRGEILERVDLPPIDFNGLTPSPDGRRLAFGARSARLSEIWLFDRDSGELRRISEGGDNVDAIWTPDGNSLTWATDRNGSYDVVSRRADSAGAIEPMVTGPGDQFPETWSADGRRLVYSEVGRRGDLDLRVLTRGEGESWHTGPLIATRAHEYLASLSPDGRWLAYVSNLDGGWRVYLDEIERPGSAVAVGEGDDPFWSPDGSVLYFLERGRLAAIRPSTFEPRRWRLSEGLGELGQIVRARGSGRGGFIAALPRSSWPAESG